MKLIILFTLLGFLASAAHAEIYKWVDDKGNVHFSDNKPESQQVEEKQYDVGDKQLDPEMVKYREQMNNQLQSWEHNEAIAKKESESASKKASEKKRFCNQLKSSLILDERVSRIYSSGADGSKKVLTADERKKRRQEMQDRFNKNCL